MWKGKRVVFEQDYPCMAYGVKILHCRHGVDKDMKSKKKYNMERDVSTADSWQVGCCFVVFLSCMFYIFILTFFT